MWESRAHYLSFRVKNSLIGNHSNCSVVGPKGLDFGKRRARIRPVSEALEKIVAALEKGQATTEQQKEAARVIRDLNQELRELLEWDQRD